MVSYQLNYRLEPDIILKYLVKYYSIDNFLTIIIIVKFVRQIKHSMCSFSRVIRIVSIIINIYRYFKYRSIVYL